MNSSEILNNPGIPGNVRFVAVQLIQACGGIDVPDEQQVPIQAGTLRRLANELVPGINEQ